MDWKVGQKLVCMQVSDPCENLKQPLLTGFVQDQNNGWVTIVCPATWIIVSRYQEQFERDGWRIHEAAMLESQVVTCSASRLSPSAQLEQTL